MVTEDIKPVVAVFDADMYNCLSKITSRVGSVLNKLDHIDTILCGVEHKCSQPLTTLSELVGYVSKEDYANTLMEIADLLNDKLSSVVVDLRIDPRVLDMEAVLLYKSHGRACVNCLMEFALHQQQQYADLL